MYPIPSIFIPEAQKTNPPACFIKLYTNEQKVEKAQIQMEMNLLSFVLEGEKNIILPHSTIRIRQENFLLLQKGKCLMTEKLSGQGNFRSILIFFENQFLTQFLQKHSLSLKPQPSDQSFSVLKRDALLEAILLSFLPYFDQEEGFAPEVSALKAEELMLQVVKLHGPEVFQFLLQEQSSIHDPAFRKVMESNILNNLSTTQLAFLCNMSLSTFRRKFEKEYGTTPGKWFTQKRLAAAAHWLSIDHKKPSEIYLDAGFESLSSFIHAFKKEFGQTPKQFQKN